MVYIPDTKCREQTRYLSGSAAIPVRLMRAIHSRRRSSDSVCVFWHSFLRTFGTLKKPGFSFELFCFCAFVCVRLLQPTIAQCTITISDKQLTERGGLPTDLRRHNERRLDELQNGGWPHNAMRAAAHEYSVYNFFTVSFLVMR